MEEFFDLGHPPFPMNPPLQGSSSPEIIPWQLYRRRPDRVALRLRPQAAPVMNLPLNLLTCLRR